MAGFFIFSLPVGMKAIGRQNLVDRESCNKNMAAARILKVIVNKFDKHAVCMSVISTLFAT